MPAPSTPGDGYAPSHEKYAAEGRVPAGHVTGNIQT
ncbi:MAG: hypothetical protein RIQ41_589, partial [Candidatus Parcubacteria bacterium]